MEIEPVIENHVYSIKYDNQDNNEYHRLFNVEWYDLDCLLKFFSTHKEYTENSFWTFLNNNPEKATYYVREEAAQLEKTIEEYTNNAKVNKTPDLDDLFEPLDGEFIYAYEQVPMKCYGSNRPSLIRLYAIKLNSNLYLIVYGGIKLSKDIKTSPELNKNVIPKIKQVCAFLKAEGIYDQEDF